MSEFRVGFTGVVVALEPDEQFQPGQRQRTNSAWRYLRQLLRHSDLLIRILVISGLLRLFGLALPILTGVIVDRVIPRADYTLLQLLGIGLVALVLFNFLATVIRSLVSLDLTTRLESEMTLRFMDHLVDLPYSFFQSRSPGDLMVRMGSNARIREIVTSSTLSALLDGSMVGLYLVLLLMASPKLAALTCVLGMTRIAMLTLVRRKQRELVSQGLDAQSLSQSYQIEMLSGVETLKCLGGERRAAERWSNLYINTLNVSVKQGRVSAWFGAAMGALGMISPFAILAVGVLEVLSGELTLGAMLAMTALAGAFLAPLDSLVSRLTQFQLLSSYLERIDDVLATPREQESGAVYPAEHIKGRLVMKNVSFRYGPASPLVIRDVSLCVEPGETIALVGRSGSGKSTLGRLLVGLYPPSEGEIVMDDSPLERLEYRSLRARMGVVMQSPYLFSGSIRSNIALANPELTLAQVIEAARLAAIHEEIVALPMGYETLLSTGGLSLSGGQRQRVALARAFASQPSIVLLDEATNQLDSVTERTIQDNLRKIRATKIIIAHRVSTISEVDRIMVMDTGRIVESGTHHELMSEGGVYAHLVDAQRATSSVVPKGAVA
jgi:ABC-type bacteriocin/lantibiotic exporter with double-glycine peptidase domain